jgi:hypothetical protein
MTKKLAKKYFQSPQGLQFNRFPETYKTQKISVLVTGSCTNGLVLTNKNA